MVCLARCNHSETQNRPPAFGRVPNEIAVGVHKFRNVFYRILFYRLDTVGELADGDCPPLFKGFKVEVGNLDRGRKRHIIERSGHAVGCVGKFYFDEFCLHKRESRLRTGDFYRCSRKMLAEIFAVVGNVYVENHARAIGRPAERNLKSTDIAWLGELENNVVALKPVLFRRLGREHHNLLPVGGKQVVHILRNLDVVGHIRGDFESLRTLEIRRHIRNFVPENFAVARYARIRQNDNVLVETALALRLRELYIDALSALDIRLCPRNVLHSVFGLNPRTARTRPARAVADGYLHSQARSLVNRKVYILIPLGRERFDISREMGTTYVQNRGRAEPHLVHRLQVGGNALF